MYPLEMSFDEFRIGFVDINNKNLFLVQKEFLDLDYRGKPKVLCNQFYFLPSTDDYILKISEKSDINNYELRQMVEDLCKRQYITNKIEFPIGYVKNGKNTIGQIVRYYPNTKSLKTICLNEDLGSLQKYIYLDDDSLHNLFLVYLNILRQVEELYENGVCYLDIHPGNIVFFKDEVKIIDFEPNYIKFSKLKCHYEQLINNYKTLVNSVLKEFFLEGKIDFKENNITFKDIKRKVINLENSVRRFR